MSKSKGGSQAAIFPANMEFLMCSFGHHRLYTLANCLEVWSSRCLTMAHRGNCKSSETDVRDPGFSHSIFPLSHARSSCRTARGLRRSVCFCIRFGMLHVLVILPHRRASPPSKLLSCLRHRHVSKKSRRQRPMATRLLRDMRR